MKKNFRVLAILASGLLIIVLSSSALAQRNPTMTGQRADAERDDLYARFLENKKLPIPERQREAYFVAKDYLKRWDHSGDEHAAELRKFVREYEKVIKDFEIYSLYEDKKYVKAFEAGRPILEKEPENFYVLAVLSEAGFDSSQTGNNTLNEETIGYARRALQLLEADKPAKADPFATKEIGRGFLNFALGWFLRTQSPSEAAAALVNAARSEGPYKNSALTYNLLGNALLKEYAKASAEYNEKFGNKPPSEEQQAALTKLMQLGERSIDAYARAVALSTKPEEQEGRTRMLAQLTNLYKSFHSNSDAGLNELIAGILAKPLPG
jgi:hypothetical protein